MNATTYGLDIAKSVFQLYWVEPGTGQICKRRLVRDKVMEFFAQRTPGLIVMEACGGAHHWARQFSALGHQVHLLPAHQVRSFVTGNKDDAMDARGIWLAAQHADVRRVPVKSMQQQAVLSLHRLRSQWVKMRTAGVNALRGLLYEFGVVLPRGRNAGLRRLAERRADIDAVLPAIMTRLLDSQLQALRELDERVLALEDELAAVQRSDTSAKRLRVTPGIGLLGATALAATLGDGSAWRNGREFACCLGLVPRHTGTGGKVRMGGISKRGDSYLRTLLIHGARTLISHSNPPPWVVQMLERRPRNVAAVALANKLARQAWAIVAHGREYDAQWKSASPAQRIASA